MAAKPYSVIFCRNCPQPGPAAIRYFVLTPHHLIKETRLINESQAPQPPIVMLVDDNDTDNLISRRVLELSGFAHKVLVQNSGLAALAYLKAHKTHTNLLPDIIFLDINMPIIDGFGFLGELEKIAPMLCKEVKVIILSSSDSVQDMRRIAGNARVLRFVTKPLSPNLLKELQGVGA